MKIRQYAVIEEYSLKTLMEKVNAAIGNGWQPHGGTAFNSALTCYIQAMVN